MTQLCTHVSPLKKSSVLDIIFLEDFGQCHWQPGLSSWDIWVKTRRGSEARKSHPYPIDVFGQSPAARPAMTPTQPGSVWWWVDLAAQQRGRPWAVPHLPYQAPWTTGPTAEASPWASFPHCQVPLETHVGLTGRKSPPGTTVKGVRLQGYRPAHLGRPPTGGCSGPGAATAQGPHGGYFTGTRAQVGHQCPGDT